MKIAFLASVLGGGSASAGDMNAHFETLQTQRIFTAAACFDKISALGRSGQVKGLAEDVSVTLQSDLYPSRIVALSVTWFASPRGSAEIVDLNIRDSQIDSSWTESVYQVFSACPLYEHPWNYARLPNPRPEMPQNLAHVPGSPDDLADRKVARAVAPELR
jgi:hypothetical protein